MNTGDSSFSLLGSWRALGRGLVDGLRDRAELAALELQQEKLRMIQTFIWINAFLFATAMALAFASLSVVYLFWDHALLALTVLAGLYAGAAIAAGMVLRRQVDQQPRPFDATIAELEEDSRCFPPQD